VPGGGRHRPAFMVGLRTAPAASADASVWSSATAYGRACPIKRSIRREALAVTCAIPASAFARRTDPVWILRVENPVTVLVLVAKTTVSCSRA
jgi:hypothetical protein